METSERLSTTLGIKGKIEITTNSVKCLAFHAVFPPDWAIAPLFPQFVFQDQQQLKQPFKDISGWLHFCFWNNKKLKGQESLLIFKTVQ